MRVPFIYTILIYDFVPFYIRFIYTITSSIRDHLETISRSTTYALCFSLRIVHYALCIMHCHYALCITHCHCALCITHCALYGVQRFKGSSFFALHTILCHYSPTLILRVLNTYIYWYIISIYKYMYIILYITHISWFFLFFLHTLWKKVNPWTDEPFRTCIYEKKILLLQPEGKQQYYVYNRHCGRHRLGENNGG